MPIPPGQGAIPDRRCSAGAATPAVSPRSREARTGEMPVPTVTVRMREGGERGATRPGAYMSSTRERGEGRRAARHMRRALELAARGRGRTSPNPMVGCVLVSPEGEVVGEGWHPFAGGPHAEAAALAAAGDAARGATAYVTLEPCDHHGRTPPCTEALIEAGVAEVVIAHLDPDPRVS